MRQPFVSLSHESKDAGETQAWSRCSTVARISGDQRNEKDSRQGRTTHELSLKRSTGEYARSPLQWPPELTGEWRAKQPCLILITRLPQRGPHLLEHLDFSCELASTPILPLTAGL